ncbi:MAG TPA: tetratricopeptide repeat protein [Terracidiphilus sp.]|jgi:tetratricopeptide repeat protein|nr:tetratricopeptide repeat protein [Terracidiphilus sp.]
MSFLRNVVLITVLMPLAASPQSPTPNDAAAVAADKAYSSQNWTDAETQYSALTQLSPTTARFWYRLSISARHNKDFDVAINAMQKAKTLGAANGLPAFIADYEIADIYAAMGDSDRALASLKASADGGFSQPARLTGDVEWSSLRRNPRFIELSKQVQHNAAPCEDPDFRSFDFWVGDWDVASAATGVHQGSSHVAKEMGACVLWENWTSAGGPYFGKSYNTWNVNLKRWEQYWVDNAAGVIFFHGGVKDGVMDYWTDDVPQSTGGTLLRHLQFFNLAPDKVRQFSQGSNDGGKTWHVEYDLVYTRQTSQPSPTAHSD